MNKKPIALLILLICMLAYIALAPFEPVSFFSIGAFQLVVVVGVVDHLIKKRKKEFSKSKRVQQIIDAMTTINSKEGKND